MPRTLGWAPGKHIPLLQQLCHAVTRPDPRKCRPGGAKKACKGAHATGTLPDPCFGNLPNGDTCPLSLGSCSTCTRPCPTRTWLGQTLRWPLPAAHNPPAPPEHNWVIPSIEPLLHQVPRPNTVPCALDHLQHVPQQEVGSAVGQRFACAFVYVCGLVYLRACTCACACMRVRLRAQLHSCTCVHTS